MAADSDPAAGAPADSDPAAGAPIEICANCRREVPSSNLLTHSLHCIRKCKACGKMLPGKLMDKHYCENHAVEEDTSGSKKEDGKSRRRRAKRLRKQQEKKEKKEEEDSGDEQQPEENSEPVSQGEIQALVLKKDDDGNDETVAPVQPEETSGPISQGEIQLLMPHRPSPGEEGVDILTGKEIEKVEEYNDDEIMKKKEKDGDDEEMEERMGGAFLHMVTPSGALSTVVGGTEITGETTVVGGKSRRKTRRSRKQQKKEKEKEEKEEEDSGDELPQPEENSEQVSQGKIQAPVLKKDDNNNDEILALLQPSLGEDNKAPSDTSMVVEPSAVLQLAPTSEEVPSEFIDVQVSEVTEVVAETAICANSDIELASQDASVVGVDQPSLVPTAVEAASKATTTLEMSTCQLTAGTSRASSLPTPHLAQTSEQAFADVPDARLETKIVLFMGYQRRIVLQKENGPFSLIAICNYLILNGRMSLPSIGVTTIHTLLEIVYHMIFPKLKDENYVSALNALKQSATGLSIDVWYTYTAEHGHFPDGPHVWIFKTLEIPLFHAWLLDPHSKEDALIINAINGRSHYELDHNISMYTSAKEAELVSPSQDPLFESSHTRWVHVSEAEDKKCELISNFLAKAVDEMTEYGLSHLRGELICMPKVPEMFILFFHSHFSIVQKHNGCLYNLHSNEGFSNSQKIWLRIDNVRLEGEYVKNPFMRCHGQQNVSRSSLESSEICRQQRTLKQPHDRQLYRARSERKPARQPPTFVAQGSSSSNTSEDPSSDNMQALYSSFLSEERDQKLGMRFLDFLTEYKENDIQYYKLTVRAMKDLNSQEMRVHYDHILAFDSSLATDLCNCFLRARKHLNNAASTFIKNLNLNEDLDFLCKNPIVRICDLPEPNWWVSVDKFFALPGNKPAVARNVYCGESCMVMPETSGVGRVVITNLFSKFAEAFCNRKSWNGKWGLPDVLVNHKLEVIINVPYCDVTTVDTIQCDLTRCASDFIPEYIVDGELPALFSHLDSTLRSFSTPTTRGMIELRKFCTFIKSHPALKSSMANLAFVDGFYSVLTSLTRDAKRLLQCIINSHALLVDWREMFLAEDPNLVPPVLASVWSYAKEKVASSTATAGESDGTVSKESEATLGQESQAEKNQASEDKPGDQKDVLPFDGDAEDGMVVMRHSRYHGTQASKDYWGNQQLGKLSHLHLINSKFMGDVLPETVQRIIYFLDDYHNLYDEETYAELLAWLNEQLDFYNRPEFPEFSKCI